MNFIKRIFGKAARKAVSLFMGTGLEQESVGVGDGAADGAGNAGGKAFPGMPELLREAAADGCVLLRNDGILPLSDGSRVSVFGRTAFDWHFVGYGSGGDVRAPYKVDLISALDEAGAAYDKELAGIYSLWRAKARNAADPGFWGHWPLCHPEMPIDTQTAESAAKRSGVALAVIGRAAGEDLDSVPEKGGYYLNDGELEMLDRVTSAFEKTVVILNVGGVIDLSWVKKYGDRISALLVVWLGGMESGRAVCDVLYGKVSPSGRLPDTFASSYGDYPSSINFGDEYVTEYEEGIYVGYRYFDLHPEKVLYPFGYGLSYTTFETQLLSLSREKAVFRVTNTGDRSGKHSLLLFCRLPEGRLDKPRRVLAAFGKTGLLSPGESTDITFETDPKTLSSFDGEKNRFILEKGRYVFGVDGKETGSFEIYEDETVEKCSEIFDGSDDLKKRILSGLPGNDGEKKHDPSVCFDDVRSGRITLDKFIDSLSDTELEALTRGHGMMGSKYGTPGNAGTFGGIIPSLISRKVPAVSCCDGPAGLRMKASCSLLPCGTLLAATFDVSLVRRLHRKLGEEMCAKGADVILSPGMNIHRDPLCGRNFEYYSEDPLLAGKIAASAIYGIKESGKEACPKHFACNNQEKGRNRNDSRVSVRALREIYLRPFEIAVKEAAPGCIMTSYNKVNGVYSHYSYDLATSVLRNEWGFDGVVMTDWWMKKGRSPEFPLLRDNAYRVRAGVDILMPGDMAHTARKYKSDGTLLESLGREGGITRGEIKRSARRTLELMLKLKK